MTLRAVFFGSSDNVFAWRFYRVLKASPCRIVAVVDVPPARRSSTNPRAARGGNFASSAARSGIPVHEPPDPNAAPFVAAMRVLAPDLFLAAGYLLRLGPDLLGVPRIVSANVHASLLPHYRGRSPVFWALRHGERTSGLTIHAMDPGLDTGDILYQARVRVRPTDDVAALYDRIMVAGVRLVPRLIDSAARGRLPRRRQPADPRKSSYFSAAKEEDFRLDWRRPASELRCWVRATPGKCFADLGGRRIYFLDAQVVPQKRRTLPAGTILSAGHATCTITTGRAALRIARLRDGSGPAMAAPRLFRQLGLKPGDLLPVPQSAPASVHAPAPGRAPGA